MLANTFSIQIATIVFLSLPPHVYLTSIPVYAFIIECGTLIACKVGLTVRRIYLKKSFIYKYKTSTLTPFAKPCII